jgi:ribosomal protein L7Ae-like RNA K-turn-binding protein
VSGIAGLLGLGLRAGQVVIGVDAVRGALQAGKCACVVVAADVTRRAEDKVLRLARAKKVPLVQGPEAAELGARLGRPPVMVAGIRDRALAAGVLDAAGRQ